MVDQSYTPQQTYEASDAGETAVRRWRARYLSEKEGKILANTQAITPEQIEIQQLKQRIK